MIKLYNVDAQGAYRTIWLLEELKLTYQIESSTPVDADTPKPSDDTITLVDPYHSISGSFAITEYLLNTYDRVGLRPPLGSHDYPSYQEAIAYAEANIIPLFLQYKLSEKLATTRVPFFARSILKKVINNVLINPTKVHLTRHFSYVESTLKEKGWFSCSHFSAADIQLSYVLEHAKSMIDHHDYPNIYHFLSSISERPAYKVMQDKINAPSVQLPSPDTPTETEQAAISEEKTSDTEIQ